MTKSRTEQLIDCLKDLQVSTPDIEASAVVSVDGLIMASSLPAGVEGGLGRVHVGGPAPPG